MSDRPDQYGFGSFSGTGVGTNAGVTVTQAAVANQTAVCTGIQCSGDAAAIVTIESPSGTVIWRKRFAAAFAFSDNFALSPLKGADRAAILVKVSASTTASEANIQGYFKP